MKFLYSIVNNALERKGWFEFQIIFDKEDMLLAKISANDQFLFSKRITGCEVESYQNIYVKDVEYDASLITIDWHPEHFTRQEENGKPYWESPKYLLEISHMSMTAKELLDEIKERVKKKMGEIKRRGKEDEESCWEHLETVEY